MILNIFQGAEQLTACAVLFDQEDWGRGCFIIPAGYLLVQLLKYAVVELYESFVRSGKQ